MRAARRSPAAIVQSQNAETGRRDRPGDHSGPLTARDVEMELEAHHVLVHS
jgi:hypothetical protein